MKNISTQRMRKLAGLPSNSHTSKNQILESYEVERQREKLRDVMWTVSELAFVVEADIFDLISDLPQMNYDEIYGYLDEAEKAADSYIQHANEAMLLIKERRQI